MKQWLWVAVACWVFLTGIASAKEFTVQKKVGDYTMDIVMDKNPPTVGKNNVAITVSGKDGKVVNDAKVLVVASMPAMPGMPAMENKADAKFEDGKYKAKIDLSMAGSWNMSVRITRDGKTATARFTVDAR